MAIIDQDTLAWFDAFQDPGQRATETGRLLLQDQGAGWIENDIHALLQFNSISFDLDESDLRPGKIAEHGNRNIPFVRDGSQFLESLTMFFKCSV